MKFDIREKNMCDNDYHFQKIESIRRIHMNKLKLRTTYLLTF